MLHIPPARGLTYQQIRFLPQQLLPGVPEQPFSLSIDANDPAVGTHNYHGIRNCLQDLSNNLAGQLKLRRFKIAHNTFLQLDSDQVLSDPETQSACMHP